MWVRIAGTERARTMNEVGAGRDRARETRTCATGSVTVSGRFSDSDSDSEPLALSKINAIFEFLL